MHPQLFGTRGRVSLGKNRGHHAPGQLSERSAILALVHGGVLGRSGSARAVTGWTSSRKSAGLRTTQSRCGVHDSKARCSSTSLPACRDTVAEQSAPLRSRSAASTNPSCRLLGEGSAGSFYLSLRISEMRKRRVRADAWTCSRTATIRQDSAPIKKSSAC
jgi:hypothetical protein